MAANRSIREVYPTVGPAHLLSPEHDYTETLQCWCKPTLLTLCGQCNDSDPACWQCGGSGVVEVERDDGLSPLIIVHSAEDILT